MAKTVIKLSIKLKGVVCLSAALLGVFGVCPVRPYVAFPSNAT
jgi:hypothetical protein